MPNRAAPTFVRWRPHASCPRARHDERRSRRLASLSACGKDDGKDVGGGSGAVKVTASDSACDLGTTTAPAGATTFKVTNKGSQVNELEVLAPDGKIVSERENIGPGTGVRAHGTLKAGAYKIACKPGMKGDGPRRRSPSPARAPRPTRAWTRRSPSTAIYVGEQVDDTLAKTKTVRRRRSKGDIAAAKAAFAPSRVGWESIEPVAESFGDIDPKTDTREADLKPGEKWTGWHQMEKALWVKKSLKGEGPRRPARQGPRDPEGGSAPAAITATSMANGAKELLDEVATGKVTGEEDRYSHTDLSDFKANVEGAQKAYELLKPVVAEKDAALVADPGQRVRQAAEAADKYGKGDGFVSYDTVGKAERKELSDAVNALAEPLSKLAAAVAK